MAHGVMAWDRASRPIVSLGMSWRMRAWCMGGIFRKSAEPCLLGDREGKERKREWCRR